LNEEQVGASALGAILNRALDLRELERNNCPILGRIFVCLQWGSNRRIASYVTVSTSLKADKKTSKIG